jgi:hypothetical protein
MGVCLRPGSRTGRSAYHAPTSAEQCRDNTFRAWAWVDSNYRPHAYQAPVKWAKSRQNAVISRVGRTICRTFPANMPEFAGIYRPNDRPNRRKEGKKDLNGFAGRARSL